MPIYEYYCESCDREFETLVFRSSDPVACPTRNNFVQHTLYEVIRFVDFVTDVESKTDYRFFFKNDIVDSIYVNISGSNMKLDSVLFKTLIKNRLYYYIANNSVIIYDGYKIVSYNFV